MIVNAILNVYGIKSDEKPEKSILTPRICDRCNTNNPGNNKFCSLCGMPLDKETATSLIQQDLKIKSANDLLDEMIKDEKFKAVFIEKVKEIFKGEKPNHSL